VDNKGGICNEVGALVGDTPLMRLWMSTGDPGPYLKLEKFNPGQSVKDRAALTMLLEAEKRGQLRPGDTIIESSSGNTGISLAMLAAARGYRLICVIDNHITREKIDMLRAYGATLEPVGTDLPPNYHAAAERLERIAELKHRYPAAYFIDQGENPDNPRAHFENTATELISNLDQIDCLVVAVGTGGSISGLARRLRKHYENIRIVAVEPKGSIIFGLPYEPFYQSGSGSAKVVFGNVDFEVIDEHCQVADATAFTSARFLARQLGLLVGGSSGSVAFESIRRAAESPGKTIVGIMADGGERYLGTIFNDEWMSSHDLFDEAVSSYLDDQVVRPPWRRGEVT
jgi:cystathionine beta-synthase